MTKAKRGDAVVCECVSITERIYRAFRVVRANRNGIVSHVATQHSWNMRARNANAGSTLKYHGVARVWIPDRPMPNAVFENEYKTLDELRKVIEDASL